MWYLLSSIFRKRKKTISTDDIASWSTGMSLWSQERYKADLFPTPRQSCQVTWFVFSESVSWLLRTLPWQFLWDLPCPSVSLGSVHLLLFLREKHVSPFCRFLYAKRLSPHPNKFSIFREMLDAFTQAGRYGKGSTGNAFCPNYNDPVESGSVPILAVIVQITY